MTTSFRIRIDPVAQRQIDEFAIYLRDCSEDFAIDQIAQLDRIIAVNLGETPLTWSYFALTGAPYRAYLFRVGRRTQYWIILHGRRREPHRQHSPFLECDARSGDA